MIQTGDWVHPNWAKRFYRLAQVVEVDGEKVRVKIPKSKNTYWWFTKELYIIPAKDEGWQKIIKGIEA